MKKIMGKKRYSVDIFIFEDGDSKVFIHDNNGDEITKNDKEILKKYLTEE